MRWGKSQAMRYIGDDQRRTRVLCEIRDKNWPALNLFISQQCATRRECVQVVPACSIVFISI